MLHLLAIDAGGTSTRAMVLTADGTCLGVGRGGRGNPVSDGAANAASSIGRAVAGALTMADLPQPAVGSVTLAMAGGSVAGTPDWLSPTLHELGVTGPVRIEPDLLAMFCSGSAALDGYGLVAGTGSTAVRVRGGDVEATTDGLGWLLGDSGSGFWIGHRVARAVAADLDGRGPSTALTPLVLAQLAIDTAGTGAQGRGAALTGLVGAVYGSSPLRLAALAPLAFADEHDDVSAQIVAEAAAALARAVLDVVVPGLDGPLVIGGGVATQARVLDPLLERLRAGGITGPLTVVGDGLVGAGVLALRRAGHTIDDTAFERLRSSTAQHAARASSS